MKKYYKILGLELNASLPEIKAARNELLEIWHPDRLVHKPKLVPRATEMTKQINNAYDILVRHKKNERKSPVEDTNNNSDNGGNLKVQSEHKHHQSSNEFEQKEKAEKERIAKERVKNQSSVYWSKVEDNLRLEEKKRKARKTRLILCSLVFIVGFAFLGWKWLISTEWWTDPHYYAPRLTKDWEYARIPRRHFVVVEPVDAGTKIEIRFNGYDKKKEIVVKKREFTFVEYGSNLSPDNGIIEVRAADAESVGKRFYLKTMYNSKR